MTQYVDFEMEVESANADGRYPMRVRSTAGQDKELVTINLEDPSYVAIKSKLDYDMPLDRADLKQLGTFLYTALMQGKIREAYRAARDDAKRNNQILRLKLAINPDEPALSAIAALPWEFAINDVGIPLGTEHSFCRFLLRSESLPKLDIGDQQLKILLTAAMPKELAEQFPVSAEQEIASIRAMLQPLEDQGKLKVIEERHLTGIKLQRLIRQEKPHVLHFVGHGVFEQETGALVLERPDGSRFDMTADLLAGNLRDSSVKLVVLNACQTGFVSVNLLQSVAPALLAANVPAIVAMQSKLNDGAGVVFAEEFYLNLAGGEAIDGCVQQGRLAIRNSGVSDVDWGLATLYMRAPDGVLFSGLGDAAAAPTTQPVKPAEQATPPPQTGGNQINNVFGSGNTFSGGNFSIGNITAGNINQSVTSGGNAGTSASSSNDDERQQDIQRLRDRRKALKDGLHVLEMQEARYGINVPVHIALEVEDTKKKITDLERQIKELGG